jgi:SNF2 family DNA or RNA helicase
MCLNYPEQPPEDDIHYKPDDYPQVTLIVAPMSLLEQWKQEIKTHCKKRTFSVFIHHGKDRVKTARQLRDQDVVLCTYQAIMRSYPSKPKGRKKMTKEEYEDWFDQAWENRGIFHRVKFWRVIMDEAHIIKNHNGRISMACQALDAVHTWALTGTPIQNSVDDVFPILKFIKHPTAIDIETYRKVVGRKDSKVKAQRVQVLVRKYMMRRTKRDYLMGRPLISLPRKRITMAELELGVEERALYMAVEAHAREKINRYIRTGTTMQNFSSMLVMLLRLRQICCHPFLICKLCRTGGRRVFQNIVITSGDFRAKVLFLAVQAISREFTIDDLNIALQTNIDDDDPDFHDLVMGTPDTSQEASGSDFTKKQQRSVLRGVLEAAKNMPLGDQDKCAICLDPKEDPVMTKCRHAFCRDCIQGVIENCMERNQLPTPCPLCKKPIESEEELRSLREVEIEAGRDADDGKCWTDQGLEFTHSAKTIALRDQLAEWRQTNPDDKIVIFSQFTKMIEIAEHVVAQEDWDYTVFRGVMDMQERQDALDTFRHNSQCKIMLISIKAGGVGLNLTQANLVLSLDLWWNAATELQAFDRVHRLGQRKQVFITRVVVKNTVETRMLELQDRKLAMAKAALGEGEANLGKLSVRDLMGLFVCHLFQCFF